jgi:hypothetical protein
VSADDHADASTPSLEPRPLRAKLFLQIAAWLSGIAGGVVFMSLLTVSTTRCAGATKAFRLRWQQRLHPVKQSTEVIDQTRTKAEPCLPSTDDETSAEHPRFTAAGAEPWSRRQHKSTPDGSRP